MRKLNSMVILDADIRLKASMCRKLILWILFVSRHRTTAAKFDENDVSNFSELKVRCDGENDKFKRFLPFARCPLSFTVGLTNSPLEHKTIHIDFFFRIERKKEKKLTCIK